MRRTSTIFMLAGFNGFVALHLLLLWPWGERHAVLVVLATIVVFAMEIAGPLLNRRVLAKLPRGTALDAGLSALVWLCYVVLGIFSCLIFYTLVADVIAIAWHVIAGPVQGAAFDRDLVPALAVVTAATAAAGIAQVLAGPRVKDVDVPLAGLPAGFDGFRIAQVSDLHVGPTIGRRYAEKVVRMVNALQPDLIALTGDLIDGPVERERDRVAPIAGLEARHGAFYITGNHEYHWGAPRWLEEFRRFGLRVLANEHAVISQGNEAIVVAGVTDHSTRHFDDARKSDPGRAFHGAPSGTTKILLAHQPISYQRAEAEGVDLQLSGHTHGGQYFPFSLLIRFFQKYYKGLNRHGQMWIYVNRGTGYWGPPLRALVPAEITLITLRAA